MYLGDYNDLTATSLGIMVSKGNHPQMALIQLSEILYFTQTMCMNIYIYLFIYIYIYIERETCVYTYIEKYVYIYIYTYI